MNGFISNILQILFYSKIIFEFLDHPGISVMNGLSHRGEGCFWVCDGHCLRVLSDECMPISLTRVQPKVGTHD